MGESESKINGMLSEKKDKGLQDRNGLAGKNEKIKRMDIQKAKFLFVPFMVA